MATKTLAVKYRPVDFEDVTEQGTVISILKQQLESGEVKNAYLFCGGAGTGKTTCARILASKINNGQGNPIELDAASNNSVEDMRDLIQQAQTRSINSEYKVFILDECHMITVAGWNALLKLIEEPPAKSIFIFCTTDPQKIPKTILSRVQRYDFQRISQQGIVDRLAWILLLEKRLAENNSNANSIKEAVEYIAKLADGGMRDAITLMDKCLSYSEELTLENVVAVLGTVDYTTMMNLTDYILGKDSKSMLGCIESIHEAGKDLKQFVKQYIQFLLDISKYQLGCDWKFISIPRLDDIEKWLKSIETPEQISNLLNVVIKLNSDIKYSATPKLDIEASLLVNM